MGGHGMEYCTAAPAFWQTMPTTTSRKEWFKRLNWILLCQRWQNSTRTHTHVVFSISQWASGFTPPAKACFYRWGSYGIIMLRKMGWSEVTNQSPLFWSYFVSIIYLVYHSQAFKVKFNQSPGAGPDASIPLHMGCPSDFHGVFVGDLAAEILKILKVCIQLDTES